MSSKMSQDDVVYTGRFDICGNWVPDDPRSMPNAKEIDAMLRSASREYMSNGGHLGSWYAYNDPENMPAWLLEQGKARSR